MFKQCISDFLKNVNRLDKRLHWVKENIVSCVSLDKCDRFLHNQNERLKFNSHKTKKTW